MLRVRPTLERFLPFLAITAAAAPLLGLLGTVIGMIKTFQLITIFGTGDAKSLSSGISEALVTTALGLSVAIPILILHGTQDRLVPLEQSEAVVKRCEDLGLACTLHVIEGAGHAVVVEKPQRVVELVEEFLSERT